MSRTTTARTYGRKTAGGRTKPLLFQTELPISPTDRKRRRQLPAIDLIDDLTEQLTFVTLDDAFTLDHLDFHPPEAVSPGVKGAVLASVDIPTRDGGQRAGETIELTFCLPGPVSPEANGAVLANVTLPTREAEDKTGGGTLELEELPSLEKDDVGGVDGKTAETPDECKVDCRAAELGDPPADDSEFLDTYCHEDSIDSGLRVLTWADMCPPGDRIEKIAEASYAEVYRVTNERGTSIIKAIRLASPIKAQTKAQVRSGLVDEEPHDEEDLRGELTISEWLADIPGFVVYKERYIVRGRAPKDLLETHQTFHRRAKRQDPDRLQFYPSPSRYLDDTRFLVIELGDAGQALEDVVLESVSQLWDVFLHVAIALARAEDQIKFEHRDLHEGNLCVRQVSHPRDKADDDDSTGVFGYSGLDITILDYGLSRAEDEDDDGRVEPIAFDLEKDLSLFTSTHAAQCKVYRQMRSHLLKGDRVHLPPECHQLPYDDGPDGEPISWKDYSPYTNVLWLAYLYGYLVRNFCGDKHDLARFRRATRELWLHISPDAPPAILSFPSAMDIVRFAVESGWLTEAQLVGGGGSSEDTFYSRHERTNIDVSLLLSEAAGAAEVGHGAADESCCGNESIIEAQIVERDESEPRRSPRRRRPVVRYG